MRTHVCTLSMYYVMLVLANLVYTQAPIAAVGGSQGSSRLGIVMESDDLLLTRKQHKVISGAHNDVDKRKSA